MINPLDVSPRAVYLESCNMEGPVFFGHVDATFGPNTAFTAIGHFRWTVLSKHPHFVYHNLYINDKPVKI